MNISEPVVKNIENTSYETCSETFNVKVEQIANVYYGTNASMCGGNQRTGNCG